MHNGTESRSGPIPPGRALVVPARSAEPPRDLRPLAGFATQLIACAGGLAPYRKRRRAAPECAAAEYEARALPPRPRTRFEQSL